MRRQPSIFNTLGFSHVEAAALDLKVDLLSKIHDCAKHYSQNELMKILKVSQPRVSRLMRGKISEFSLDTLVEYAQALNLRPEIVTHAPVVMLEDARV